MGYSRRGWLAYMTCGGAIAVALIMALSPAATAASAGVVIHPGYKGVVSPSNSVSQSGCGKVAAKHWHFSLKTGSGGVTSKGLASSCKKQVGSIGQTSSASTYGSVTVGVLLPKISASATNITANVATKYTAALSASDGGRSAVCNNAATTSTYDYTTWEWNNFHNYAYTDNYSYNGVYYNYSYNVASIPSPFNLNNTTYYYHDSGYSTFAFCEAFAYMFAEVYAYLMDLTLGTNSYPSSNGIGSNGIMFDTELGVENSTDWGASQYYYWDEGTQYGSNNTTLFSYNTSLTSFQYVFYPTFSYTTGTNNTLTWSSAASSTGQISWLGSFSHHDHYAIEMVAVMDASASNSWQHGSASWSFNMATLGNGLHLTSISIT